MEEEEQQEEGEEEELVTWRQKRLDERGCGYWECRVRGGDTTVYDGT